MHKKWLKQLYVYISWGLGGKAGTFLGTPPWLAMQACQEAVDTAALNHCPTLVICFSDLDGCKVCMRLLSSPYLLRIGQ